MNRNIALTNDPSLKTCACTSLWKTRLLCLMTVINYHTYWGVAKAGLKKVEVTTTTQIVTVVFNIVPLLCVWHSNKKVVTRPKSRHFVAFVGSQATFTWSCSDELRPSIASFSPWRSRICTYSSRCYYYWVLSPWYSARLCPIKGVPIYF